MTTYYELTEVIDEGFHTAQIVRNVGKVYMVLCYDFSKFVFRAYDKERFEKVYKVSTDNNHIAVSKTVFETIDISQLPRFIRMAELYGKERAKEQFGAMEKEWFDVCYDSNFASHVLTNKLDIKED
jgi:hypothetical protein